VGVFFITQTPGDVADNVLAQLGNRVQHAVRAFTPKDAKNLKATASTFPPNPHVDVQKTLTALGTGEALVSILNPKGVPTPVAPTQILAPASMMGPIDDAAYREVIGRSYIAPKYANAIDRESAREILQRKLAARVGDEAPAQTAPSKGAFDDMMNSPLAKTVIRTATSQAARTVTQQVIRGIFGMLKGR
jgi:hypothetical protein